MQKVITISSTHDFQLSGDEVQSRESTYPELDKLLAEGYVVKQVFSDLTHAGKYLYSMATLLLEKV